ncbi:MAG: U3 snoRNP protein [Alectoria sarmentosa]|nr:MAG: U3 snoRNP protein [Alectoria sarmentosa]CAD6579757.1 MAG: U3 snoRNP protein [Alectoria sarmentosa]
MAGASDKARFYQEQSVPELQEFARKNIFTKEEIASIARKRSDFEHILNARGSKPQDYARYTEYEMNLESLRRKRVKRLGIKISNHTGQRRIFFILDRATRKFHGDIGLWMQYIAFARKQRSHKRVSQIITKVLRLHPTRPELWIYVATNYLNDGDITEARAYMQRGLRFCKGNQKLWVEYAKMEMINISKIAGRARILGLDVEKIEEKNRLIPEDDDEDMITLPANTSEDIVPTQRPSAGVEQKALEKLSTSPALSGAIPLAIFDAARKHFDEDNELCQNFFDMVAEFCDEPCHELVLSHIMDTLRTIAPESPGTLIRWIRQPVIGIDTASPEFPALFGLCLDRIKTALTPISTAPETTRPFSILGQKVIAWMLTYQEEDLDTDVREVMRITIRKVESISARL